MKLWIYSVVFTAAILSVSCQTCPSDYFTAAFFITVEARFKVTSPPFIPDPELTYFKDLLNFRDDDIQHFIEDAIKFFNDSFGLDFSDSIPNEQNERFIENAKMSPFRTSPEVVEGQYVTVNTWLRSGSTRSNCYQMQDGAFAITFVNSATVYGSYGGPAGKPIGPTDQIVYGFYHFDVCQQSPVVIQLQSATPFRTVPVDGVTVFSNDVYSTVLGYGRVEGRFSVRPEPDDPGYLRLRARTSFTFPADVN